jgi:hypothetical protein
MKSDLFPSELRGVRSGEPVSLRRRPRFVTLSAIAFVVLLSGCASYPIQLASDSSFLPMPVPTQALQFAPTTPPLAYATAPRAPAEVHLASASRLSRRERALLAPRPAPDCAFVESKQTQPVDADEWARTKLDYERSCYRRAEAETRDRLRRLQKVVRQTATPAVPRVPVADVPRRDDPFAPFYEQGFATPYAYGGFGMDFGGQAQ